MAGGIVECGTSRALWLSYVEVADIEGPRTERALSARSCCSSRARARRVAHRRRRVRCGRDRSGPANRRTLRRSRSSRDRLGPPARSAVQWEADSHVEVLLTTALEACGSRSAKKGVTDDSPVAANAAAGSASRLTGCGVCCESGRAWSLSPPRSTVRVASSVVRQRSSPAGSTRARRVGRRVPACPHLLPGRRRLQLHRHREARRRHRTRPLRRALRSLRHPASSARQSGRSG